ncbi:hypothetical protein DPMN_067311 [Dreissena polymorpha]|uniref:Uncharacterized protein n=1 Tax=Dreissena polymorpha TaxID=45954 RepID=A0A9D3Z022_DREPO|nr:hypothetical protein DPMN_067311 [Dreissena polymorpha]
MSNVNVFGRTDGKTDRQMDQQTHFSKAKRKSVADRQTDGRTVGSLYAFLWGHTKQELSPSEDICPRKTLCRHHYENFSKPKRKSVTDRQTGGRTLEAVQIYVANWDSNQLVTLSRDGTVISRFTDPILNEGCGDVRPGLHVTDSGQVLVCGGRSHTIIQRLAEVITRKDDVFYPGCDGLTDRHTHRAQTTLSPLC